MFSKLHPFHISISVVYFTICSSNITSKNAMKTKQDVSTHGLTIASCKYRMVRNFCGDKIFADWPLAKISRESFRGLTIAKPRPYWVPANHTHITRESAAMAKELTVEAMVHGYHIYEDILDATAGEEQPCQNPISKPSSTSHDSLT